MRIERVGPHTLVCGNSAEFIKQHSGDKFAALITDPPYGVELSGKSTKHTVASGVGYSEFADTLENVRDTVVPIVSDALKICVRGIVTPGVRAMRLYPEWADMGVVFNDAGAGSGPWGFVGVNPILYYGQCPYTAAAMGSRPSSWRQPPGDRAPDVKHPCPKPPGMMNWLVARGSLPGETVLDTFMGAGGTAVAAILQQRIFTGCEMGPEYFEIALWRARKAWESMQ